MYTFYEAFIVVLLSWFAYTRLAGSKVERYQMLWVPRGCCAGYYIIMRGLDFSLLCMALAWRDSGFLFSTGFTAT